MWVGVDVGKGEHFADVLDGDRGAAVRPPRRPVPR
jgi:hypothetical protein